MSEQQRAVGEGLTGDDLLEGVEVDVEVEGYAHGGHCVARHDGRVLFVRHTLPGERVRARVTESTPGRSFVRADAVEVLRAAPERVERRCGWSGPGLCGGCDLQHVEIAAQRRLKAAAVAASMERIGGLDVTGLLAPEAEPVAGDESGLRWRTRTTFAVDDRGRPGLRAHRSHEIVPVDDCPITVRPALATGVLEQDWEGALAVTAVAPSVGDPVLVPVGERGRPLHEVPRVTEAVATPEGERRWTIGARGFWQVHPGAPATLVSAVLEAAAVQPGDRVLDLYCGAGLLTLPLAEATGDGGQVVGVEGAGPAVDDARAALAEHPWVALVASRVDEAFGLARTDPGRRRPRRGRARGGPRARHDLLPPTADVVVLDPPREGAGAAVVAAIADLRPRTVVHVACDPAALARDAAAFVARGYELSALRAFDAFPMTHHVECVATFRRADAV